MLVILCKHITHSSFMLKHFLLGDQLANAKLAKRHDFIVDLDWNTVTENELLEAINEVLKNPK